jgi:hypothetical protein
MNMDIKLVVTRDGAKSWSAPENVSTSHRAYLPGMVERRSGELLAVWMDFVSSKPVGRIGKR